MTSGSMVDMPGGACIHTVCAEQNLSMCGHATERFVPLHLLLRARLEPAELVSTRGGRSHASTDLSIGMRCRP